jgi:methylated-DNA-[protein]-cysteine S-methyltransferase
MMTPSMPPDRRPARELLAEARCTLATPVGRVVVTARDTGVTGVYTQEHAFLHRGAKGPLRGDVVSARAVPARSPREALLSEAARQLLAYFAGERTRFELPLAAHGTPFQHDVWRALAAIPFGETTTYAALAARLGRPSAFRAVASANARNPISIVVPCHRVIGSDGALRGYAGGLACKRWLLDFERSRDSRGARE